MSVVERVNKAWDRIEAWYKTTFPDWTPNAGASEADIAALEKDMGITFPEELRVSLKRHNGIEDGKWPRGGLLNLAEIREEWNTWTDMARNDELDDDGVETDGTFQQKWWCESWIPIDQDGGGNFHMIDLLPGTKGRKGQVLYFYHETGPEKSKYPDYIGYLETVADGFEKGKYTIEESGIYDNEADGEEGEGDEGDEEGEGDEGDEEDEEEDEEDEEEEKSKNKKKVKK